MRVENNKAAKLIAFFEDLWRKGDPWSLDSSEFEHAKYVRQIELLGPRRFDRVLEIGCGAGAFTALLAHKSNHITAIDISPTAISLAKRRLADAPNIQLRQTNIMESHIESLGNFDLTVMSETIYYLGWLYSFFDVSWLSSEIFHATRSGGLLLMANTYGLFGDYLVSPWIIRTYRDLFVNAGFGLETEETFRGVKNGVELDVLISLFIKTPG